MHHVPFECGCKRDVNEVLVGELCSLSDHIHVVGGLGPALNTQGEVGWIGRLVECIWHCSKKQIVQLTEWPQKFSREVAVSAY